MDDDVKHLLLMQEFETDEGEMHNIIWKVPAGSFLIAVQDRMDSEGLSINKAKIAVLNDFYKARKAHYVGTTDQYPELFAANLREDGIKARYVKSMEDIPDEFRSEDGE